LGQPYPLRALCDADWASDIEDRRSTFGSTIHFGPNLISWRSQKQQVVARSSTKAEYQSLAQTTTKISWIETLMTELKVSFSIPMIFCDNQSAVAIAHNHVLHARTKHMEIDIFFIREKVSTMVVKIKILLKIGKGSMDHKSKDRNMNYKILQNL